MARLFTITQAAALPLLLLSLLLSGCGGSSDNSAAVLPPPLADSCSIDGQKQFVLDAMRDVYFWSDLLPADVDLDAFATPEALLADLISVQPLDNFSFISSLAADTQFFGEGQYEGFGFSISLAVADELHLRQVFSSSPAAEAGLARGQQVLTMNGRTIADIEAGEGIDAFFDLPAIDFAVLRPDNSEFIATVNKGLVTIDPIPQWRVIERPGTTPVGYLELASFVGTAHAAFATVFAEFSAAGVTDVILDLRYNGGGRVDTTELLGDYLGGVANEGLVFSQTRFNANNAFSNRNAIFTRPQDSIILSSLVVIATEQTASASELITNSMFPHANVAIVGDTTLGKPVGQLGLQFCDNILRPTAFETLNANDEGGYFAGLPADCPVADDLLVAVGADTDPNLATALYWLQNGSCPPPVNTLTAGEKPQFSRRAAHLGATGPAWSRLAGAW